MRCARIASATATASTDRRWPALPQRLTRSGLERRADSENQALGAPPPRRRLGGEPRLRGATPTSVRLKSGTAAIRFSTAYPPNAHDESAPVLRGGYSPGSTSASADCRLQRLHS